MRPCPTPALALCGALLLALPPGLAFGADFTGLVHARHQLALSVATPGVVAAIPVQAGRRVQAGQLLLQLDDRLQAIEEQRRKAVLDDRSEIDAMQARLAIVQPLADDARRLQGTAGALSREDAARTELDLLATRGRLLQLQAQKVRERVEHEAAVAERAQRRLTAPVAGVVSRVVVDVGEWARPGDPLIELVDATQLHLRVNVPAAATRALKPGMPLRLRFDPALGLADVEGRLDTVAPAVDAASGLVELRVQFANAAGRVPPGIKAQVALP
jgi:RND family efflux transporter MFP subunit